MESEGHEEKYRAAVDGGYPDDEPVGQRWAGRVCTIETKAFSFTHHHQGVCGQHGTEEQRVTSGELAESPGGTGVSGPISVSEVASEALSVVGRLNSTYEARRKPRDRATGDRMGRGRQPAKMVGRRKETR
jgi:hypothetical protein